LASRRAPRDDDEAQGIRPLRTEELFLAHGATIWRALRRLGVMEVDVDDVCQEVFLIVHQRLHTFEGRSSALTWIYGICVRVASDYRKRLHGASQRSAECAVEPRMEGRQEEAFAIREARAKLDRILDTLDSDKRSVFVLFEIEEMAMADVAIALGCPLQTAYSRLHAARREVDAAIARLSDVEAFR